MRKSGNSLQRFAPNVPTFQQNVRANLANFIQELFWCVSFSNEDFKTVEESLAIWQSSRFELEYSWIKMLFKVLDVSREAKRFISESNLKKLKEKVRTDTLKVQGLYLAYLCLWGSPSPEVGQFLHIFIDRSVVGLEFSVHTKVLSC